MKKVSKDEVREYSSAISGGFFKGALLGSVFSLGLFGLLRRKSSLYNTFTTTTRTFFGLTPPILFGVTNAEWASRGFDEKRYKFGQAADYAVKEQKRFEDLSFHDRLMYDLEDNKYKIIFGLWAGSLAGSFWWINRDKLMSRSQKIVQARMYAQALSIVILLGTMFLSHKSYNMVVEEDDQDNDWKAIAAEEEEREKKAGLSTHLDPETLHKHHKDSGKQHNGK